MWDMLMEYILPILMLGWFILLSILMFYAGKYLIENNGFDQTTCICENIERSDYNV